VRRTAVRVAPAEVSDSVVDAAGAGASTFMGAITLFRKDRREPAPRPSLARSRWSEKDMPWNGFGARLRGRHAAAIRRGLALGLPLLVVFGGLFIAADAVFRSLLAGADKVRRPLAAALLARPAGRAGILGWNASGAGAEAPLAKQRAELRAYTGRSQPP
jgi:hypothetical protein